MLGGSAAATGGRDPFTFSHGQSVDLTFIFIYSRGNDSTTQGSVTRLLEHDAPRIRQWYVQGIFLSCLDLSTVGVAELKVQETQVCLPESGAKCVAGGAVRGWSGRSAAVRLQGRLLQTQSLLGAATHVMDVQALRSGMYLVWVQQAGKLKQQKTIKHWVGFFIASHPSCGLNGFLMHIL